MWKLRFHDTWKKYDEWGSKEIDVGEKVEKIVSRFRKSVDVDVVVPTNVYLRTDLLCDFISEEVDVAFGINDFIGIIYEDFIIKSIKDYDPYGIHKDITRTNGYNETILVHQYSKYYEIKKRESSWTTIECTIGKKDAQRGLVLLAEMEEIHSTKKSLGELVSTLWVNFIEDYKSGDNKNTLYKLIEMLHKQNSDEKTEPVKKKKVVTGLLERMRQAE